MAEPDRTAPSREKILENDFVLLRSLDTSRDGKELFEAASVQTNGEDIFRYHLANGPFSTYSDFEFYLKQKEAGSSELTVTVFSKPRDRLVGAVSFLNIRPDHGSVELGSIWYQKAVQRTEVNTNVMYLLFSYVFDELKYRRLEWKCNNENEASKRAALRLGFQYEGLFRQHFWDKGKNRDTAWFSVLDSEWPAVRERFETKLLRRR